MTITVISGMPITSAVADTARGWFMAGLPPDQRHGRPYHDDEDHPAAHRIGLTDAQRAALVAIIEAAPLPPPEVIARLRGYLPPVTPD